MSDSIQGRHLTIANFAVVVYFIILWLINYYRIDFVLIGVFRELLTIPFLFAQIVLLVLGIKSILSKQLDSLGMISLLALGICSCLTIGSFFI